MPDRTLGAPVVYYTDPATGRHYTIDSITGESRWVDGPAPPPPAAGYPQQPSPTPFGSGQAQGQRPKPKTVAGIVGLIVASIALLLSWVPIVNTLAFVFALVSGALGVVGAIATRPAGKRSARWAAVSSLAVTGLAIVVVLATQSFYGHAVNEAAKGLAPSIAVSTAPGAVRSSGAAQGLPDGVARFGSAVTFKDGSTLDCGKPTAFKRDQFAAGGEDAAAFMKSRCTFTNRSSKVFQPGGTTGSMSAGGVEGESVFQPGLDAPDNPVLPGKSVSWWMGYGVTSTKDLQLTVQLGFLNYSAVTFVA